jgi:hypothetical protein
VSAASSDSDSRAPLLRGKASSRQQQSQQHREQQQREQQQKQRKLVVGETSCILYTAATKYAIEEDQEGEEEQQHDQDDNNDNNDNNGNIIIKYTEKEQLYCEFENEYARTVLGINDPLVELNGLLQSDIDIGREGPTAPAATAAASDSAGDSASSFERTPQDRSAQPERGIESGLTTITFREGIIDRTDNVMYVDKSLIMDVGSTINNVGTMNTVNNDSYNRLLLQTNDHSNSSRRRQLTSTATTGTKKALVVRIITSDGIEPEVNRTEVSHQVFTNDISLSKQYKACSYGKLQIEPYEGTTITGVKIQDGIVDITLSKDVTTDFIISNGLSNLARYMREATIDALGSIEENNISFVMFVFPDGISPCMATAIANRYDSYYSKRWILPPSFVIHEVGHNLGLKHSGENGDQYADKTGYMGYSYAQLDGPSMCFNVAQNYKLNWYKEQTVTYNPFQDQQPSSSKQFTLNGVDDYKPNANANANNEDAVVVLRLLQTDEDSDYYIGYNKVSVSTDNKMSINRDTFENKNEILIIHKDGTPESTSHTMKNGTLAYVGDYYEIKNFNNELSSVYILFQSLSANGVDAVIIVSTTEPVFIPENDPLLPINNEEDEDFTDNSLGLEDRTDFKFKNKRKKNCKWIGRPKKKSKRKKRCKKTWKHEKIGIYWCSLTCKDLI